MLFRSAKEIRTMQTLRYGLLAGLGRLHYRSHKFRAGKGVPLAETTSWGCPVKCKKVEAKGHDHKKP